MDDSLLSQRALPALVEARPRLARLRVFLRKQSSLKNDLNSFGVVNRACAPALQSAMLSIERRNNVLKKLLKLPLVLLLVALGFFVVTFTVYFFNLDMKATSLLAPFLEKWYDNLERKTYL